MRHIYRVAVESNHIQAQGSPIAAASASASLNDSPATLGGNSPAHPINILRLAQEKSNDFFISLIRHYKDAFTGILQPMVCISDSIAFSKSQFLNGPGHLIAQGSEAFLAFLKPLGAPLRFMRPLRTFIQRLPSRALTSTNLATTPRTS